METMSNTARAVRVAFRAAGYREPSDRYVGGDVEIVVRTTRAAGGGDTRSVVETVWAPRRRRGSPRSGVNVEHVLIVPRTWLRRVRARGLAVVDGLLTLDAVAVPRRRRPEGVEAWAATWVVQSRGVSVRAEHGLLVREHGHVVHAQSISAGRRMISRRRDTPMARGRALAAYAASHPDLVVTLADSGRAGNCPSGSRDWAARHLAGRTSATVAEIARIAFASRDRVHLVAAAVRVAVRRHEATAAAAAAS